MRNLNRNKQTLWYALYKGREPRYKLDEDGNKILVYEDTSVDPPVKYYEENGTEDVYYPVKSFKGNIAFSGGDSQMVDFGVNLADYEAILVTEKDLLPITETSLIWYETDPISSADGTPDTSTADYRVSKVKKSLNQDRYILSKVVKNTDGSL